MTYIVPPTDFWQWKAWALEQEWLEGGAECPLEEHIEWSGVVTRARREVSRNTMYWERRGVIYNPFYTIFGWDGGHKIEVVNPNPCAHSLQKLAKKWWDVNDFWG